MGHIDGKYELLCSKCFVSLSIVYYLAFVLPINRY